MINRFQTILDLHPGTYAGPARDPDLDGIAAAADRLNQFQQRVADVAARRLKGNPMETAAANARALVKFVDAGLATAAREFHAHRAGVMKRLADLRAGIEQPLVQAAERGPLAAEYRAVFRSLDGDARDRFLRDATDAGDVAAVGAILGASPMLSGLTPGDYGLKRSAYLAKAHGETVARMEAIQKAQDRLDKAATLLVARVSALVDRKALEAAEADDAAIRTAEAV